jgi:hypothetical protein
MSWSFHALVLGVAVIWGLAPQIACFIPDQPRTQHEMDCCEQMAGECGRMEMSCCQKVVRTDTVGITAKAVRHVAPQTDIAPKPLPVSIALPIYLGDSSIRNDHAPPHDIGASPLVLRI